MEQLKVLKAQLEDLGQGHIFAQLADELQDVNHPVAQQLLRINVAGKSCQPHPRTQVVLMHI